MKWIGNFCCQSFSHTVIAPWIFRQHIGGADDHFSANGFQYICFFFGLFVCSYKNAFISFYTGHQRQTHACIARCTFNDRSTRFQFALFLGHFDHLNSHAVFDRIAGIEIIHFGKNRAGNIPGDLIQFYQGSVADRFQYVILNVHC